MTRGPRIVVSAHQTPSQVETSLPSRSLHDGPASGQRQDGSPHGRVVLVLLGDRERAVERKVELGRRRIGDERVRRPADEVGSVVLQEQMRDRHIGAQQLLMACDRTGRCTRRDAGRT